MDTEALTDAKTKDFDIVPEIPDAPELNVDIK